MDRITFENLPSQKSALSAEKLNQMQDNIEEAINEIIDSGSNDNGSYVKFSDGTMICRKTIPKENFLTTQTNVTAVQGISIYRSGAYLWNFPVAFIDTDIQINVQTVTLLNGTRFAQGRINGGSVTKTGVQIQVLGLEGFLENEVGYTNLSAVQVTAFGKWK